MCIKPRIIVTHDIASSSITGHLYEVAEYAFYLAKRWKRYLQVEMWLPYKKVFFFRVLKLRYKQKFISELYDLVKYRYLPPSMSFVVNYRNEIQSITKASCVFSTNARLFYNFFTKFFHWFYVFIHTFIGLHCHHASFKGLVTKHLYLLYNNKIYANHPSFKPTFESLCIEPATFRVIDNYVKKIAYSQLLFCKDRPKDLGSIIIDKNSYVDKKILEDVDTVIVKHKHLRSKYKGYRVLTFPIANFLSRISKYKVLLPKEGFDCSNRLIKECQYFDIPVDATYANVSCITERLSEPIVDLMSGDDILDNLIEEYLMNVDSKA